MNAFTIKMIQIYADNIKIPTQRALYRPIHTVDTMLNNPKI